MESPAPTGPTYLSEPSAVDVANPRRHLIMVPGNQSAPGFKSTARRIGSLAKFSAEFSEVRLDGRATSTREYSAFVQRLFGDLDQ